MLGIVSAFVGALPLTTGAYMTLNKTWQIVLVAGIGVYRVACITSIKKVGLGSDVSIIAIVTLMIMVDFAYEIHASSLLAGAKSGIALVLPALMDLGGNMFVMTKIWLNPISPGNQFRVLVAIALREMAEMAVSVGVMSGYTGIYFFNRYDFYMLDVVSYEAFRNAWIIIHSPIQSTMDIIQAFLNASYETTSSM